VEEQGNGAGPGRGPIETALLAGLGWASLTAEAADDLADDLARLVGIERDDLRRAVRDTFATWRREAESGTHRRDELIDRLIAKLRLVQREETDDLELRVAQLEHRMRLLESGPSSSGDE
jgi:polyhydroxyalkanoate synthesis regulator phasin